jgi:hypothetical protein
LSVSANPTLSPGTNGIASVIVVKVGFAIGGKVGPSGPALAIKLGVEAILTSVEFDDGLTVGLREGVTPGIGAAQVESQVE